MGMAPYFDDPALSAPFFKKARSLFEKVKSNDLTILSMGMSHDFEIALEEGANMIRVGTGIFGEREYK